MPTGETTRKPDTVSRNTPRSRAVVLCGVAAALLLVSAGCPQAGAFTAHAAASAATAGRSATEEERGELGAATTAEKQGYGCLAAGGASLVLTQIAGTNEMILVLAGSTLAPSTPVGVGLAVTSLMFASACAVGALVAPTAIRLWRYYYDGVPIAADPAR